MHPPPRHPVMTHAKRGLGARLPARLPVRGFTFIELMMTLAIMATLAMVAVPLGQVALQREKERALRIALIEIREGIDAYKKAADAGRIERSVGDSGYPKKLEDLVDGVQDVKNPAKPTIYFLRRLPRDPFFVGPAKSAADTWQKRSYASPPDSPSEGSDVFDVYSRSGKIGLNGVPLNEW
jgi:general secretion pathway protein G